MRIRLSRFVAEGLPHSVRTHGLDLGARTQELIACDLFSFISTLIGAYFGIFRQIHFYPVAYNCESSEPRQQPRTDKP